jgi:glycosyltransferase involved in cell wall biosynthesis
MRIGIDARFLTHPQAGGFKTYTKSLIAALAEIDSENEYLLYLDRAPDGRTQLPGSQNFSIRVVPGSTPLVGMLWREQIRLSRQAQSDRLNLLHSPSLTAPLRLACPSVVTIHDMIWYFPERFSNGKSVSGKRKLMERYYRSVPKVAARKAAAVITVSYAAKESIVQHLGISPDQIFVTHEAASCIYRQVSNQEALEGIRQKYNLTTGFVLAIGSADPRKNIKSLVQAYASLPKSLQERYHLAVVWTHTLLADELAQQVEALNLKDRVQFLQRVPDEDLVLLYNAATLFVFPSLYEGFGLPPLEAMACGTPVVATNNSSIPEIVGDAALLTEAEDVATMTELMAKVLDDDSLQRALIEKGLNQAAQFSWRKCGYKTLDTYKKAVSQQQLCR